MNASEYHQWVQEDWSFPFNRNAVKVVNYNVQDTGEDDHDDNVGGENNPGT